MNLLSYFLNLINSLFQVPEQYEWCESISYLDSSSFYVEGGKNTTGGSTFFREPYNVLTGFIFFAVFVLLYNMPIINRHKESLEIAKTLVWIGMGTILYHGTLYPLFKVFDQMSVFMLILYLYLYNLDILRHVQMCVNVFLLCMTPVFLLFPIVGDFFLIVAGVLAYIYCPNLKYSSWLIFLWAASISFWLFDKMCLSIVVGGDDTGTSIVYLHTHWLFHITINFLAYYGILFLRTGQLEKTAILQEPLS